MPGVWQGGESPRFGQGKSVMLVRLTLAVLFLLWAGMIIGISCLEARIKFKAPGLSRIVGLEVGRIVFAAFHKVQWGILFVAVLVAAFSSHLIFYIALPFLLIILLGIQTLWLFPFLSKNAEIILAKEKYLQKTYYFWYNLLEMAKLLLLIGGGVCFFYKV